MLKNKLLYIFLGTIIIFFSLLYIKVSTTKDLKQTMPSFHNLQDRELVEVVFKNSEQSEDSTKKIPVEVVNTPESTTLGLSNRKKIGSEGMLFIFPQKSKHYFWMKDMNFNLDLIWLADNKVVEITKNVLKPEENTPDNRLQTYSSEEEIDMVLEVMAGDAEKLNITVGNTIQLVE